MMRLLRSPTAGRTSLLVDFLGFCCGWVLRLVRWLGPGYSSSPGPGLPQVASGELSLEPCDLDRSTLALEVSS